MGSILTNNSAMVALQTLKSINSGLAGVQSEISTGLKVGKAKDNAAIFAISQVMRSDVKGFEAISESLSLGSSTLAVASAAAKSVNDTLEEIKAKIVAANEDNVDAQALQNEIVSLRDQVGGIVSAAQFNGLNLLDGSAGTVSILSSLDRDAAGNVSSSTIDVASQNLSSAAGAARAALAGSDGVTAAGDDAAFSFNAADGAGTGTITIATGTLQAGDTVSISVDDVTVSVVVQAADLLAGTADNEVIATNLRNALVAEGIAGLVVDQNGGDILFGNDGGAASADRSVTATVTSVGAGGLSALAGIDVTADAAGALTTIETLINTVVDAQAALGTAEARIEIQADFLGKLTDSFKSGIGSLVDADLEEASARLQSLQVQQQLGTQALSIANQAPQSILSLFR